MSLLVLTQLYWEKVLHNTLHFTSYTCISTSITVKLHPTLGGVAALVTAAKLLSVNKAKRFIVSCLGMKPPLLLSAGAIREMHLIFTYYLIAMQNCSLARHFYNPSVKTVSRL